MDSNWQAARKFNLTLYKLRLYTGSMFVKKLVAIYGRLKNYEELR